MMDFLKIQSFEPPEINPIQFSDPFCPPLSLNSEAGHERNISKKQRKWILERDSGLCSFPVINKDGTFGGYLFEDDQESNPCDFDVHHIYERGLLRRSSEGSQALASGWHNSPTNLILLDKRVHGWLHRRGTRWMIEEYKRTFHLDEIPREESKVVMGWAYQNNIPSTLSRYNIYMIAIATTRSLYMMKKKAEEFPFDKAYKGHTVDVFYNLYDLIPEFIDSFIERSDLYM